MNSFLLLMLKTKRIIDKDFTTHDMLPEIKENDEESCGIIKDPSRGCLLKEIGYPMF